MIKLKLVLRDMLNRDIDLSPDATIVQFVEDLQSPYTRFLVIADEGKTLMINKADIMKVEWVDEDTEQVEWPE